MFYGPGVAIGGRNRGTGIMALPQLLAQEIPAQQIPAQQILAQEIEHLDARRLAKAARTLAQVSQQLDAFMANKGQHKA